MGIRDFDFDPHLQDIFIMSRLLITGSRNWTNREVIYNSLASVNTSFNIKLQFKNILIQGECPYGGADAIAKEIWESWGLEVETYPAEVVDGKILGPQRNAKMVKSGADLCLGFPLENSRGTYNCMTLAYNAGIPTILVREDGTSEMYSGWKK